MTTTEILLLVLVLLVVAAVAALLLAQRRKRAHLRSTFGPEYDRTVEGSSRRSAAERELAEREERRRSLDIRPLPEQDRTAFADRWRTTQADFVDHPELAVRQADLLVTEVMARRGYPVDDFEQMSRDVSVDHADVVHEYRAAHDISELNDRKQATTEQLRQAMVHYRALFDDLLRDDRTAADDGDGRRDEARYDGARHDDAPYDDAPYDEAGRDGAPYDEAGRDDAPYDVGDGTVGDRRSGSVESRGTGQVRVEPGGLDRGRGDRELEPDLPREERPRA